MKSETTLKNSWLLMTILGTILFVILYGVASYYYPGGSQFNKHSVGFSWKHNYWCNLLNDTAINGQKNTAQPIALIATIILSLVLSFFWWQFPKYINYGKKYNLVIRVCGTLAVIVGLFLFTNIDHHLITSLASLLGLIAATGTILGLYRKGWITLFYFGLVNFVLVLVNNFLYYNEELIYYLPMVQKVTFATFLSWIFCVNLKMLKLKTPAGNKVLEKVRQTEYLKAD